jgi:spermidine dehydrogenase
MKKKQNLSAKQKAALGIDRKITRRDFLNGILLGIGAALLELPAPVNLSAQSPSWDGYGGVGDYAESHGNTGAVVRVGHELRDGRYEHLRSGAIDTGEIFDLVIIGGGMSGLSAAFYFKKAMHREQKCLVIENHPIFGGEAKRNEFVIDGHRFLGPQGANSFSVIDEIFSELGIPRNFRYQTLPSELKPLEFDRTNFGFMQWKDLGQSSGYFFEHKKGAENQWVPDIWRQRLKDTPFSEKERQDLLAWRSSRKKYHQGEDSQFGHWLDRLTYKEYIEKTMGLSSEVTKFADPILASSIGLGCDVISAYAAYQIALPGFQAFADQEQFSKNEWHSFPGGNDAFPRYLVKRLIPDAIKGRDTFEDILNQPVRFESLDRQGNNIRMRLGSTVVGIAHEPTPEKSEYVRVTYVKRGKIYSLRARGAVIASGSWISRRIFRDLPAEYKEALMHFYHSPVLAVNVALTNWRFLYRLGLTACRWFDGFGFSCNIRQPMIVGDYRPPLHPDKPAVMTFYVPFYYPGLSIREQGVKGRYEFLSTSYYEYELKIREQMVRLFGKAGFDPKKDIAGIILNRWGHAYVNPQPGFYFGGNGKPAPRDIIRKGFGRVAFGHSELHGHQHWAGAMEEGRRAAEQAMKVV